MKVLARAVLATAASLVGWSAIPAHAEGLYFGGNLGGSHYKGASVGGVETDRSDTGLKIHGGYAFTPNFALETGYARLGRFDSPAGRVKADGYFADAVGTVPLVDRLSAFGRVGVFNGKLDSTLQGSERSTNYKVGAGLQYDLTKNIGVRGEWERYRFDAFSGKSNTDLYSVGVNYRF